MATSAEHQLTCLRCLAGRVCAKYNDLLQGERNAQVREEAKLLKQIAKANKKKPPRK